MKSSFKLGRIAGIEIGLHYTWIFAFILIAWSLAQGFFPYTTPGLSAGTYWIMGTVASLLLFVSVLLHELAHSLVAKSRGLNVRSITLFIFGGVSNLEGEPAKAGVEFTMAVVGPLTSLVLGGIFWGIGVANGVNGNPLSVLAGIRQNSPGAALLAYLSSINLLLGVFNLIPGFPLDGGRVLRSIIWGTTKSLNKATNIAALVGRYFGWAFIAFGVFQLLSGNFLGGLWIAFIGWFLSSAADASRREVTLREQLSGVHVQDVMDPSPITASPNTTVEEVIHSMFIQRGCRAVPVSKDNRLLGIATIDDVKKLDRSRWATTPIAEIMTSQPLQSVKPEDELSSALSLITQHGYNQLPVVRDGQLAGMVCRADILRHLQVSQELGIRPGQKKEP